MKDLKKEYEELILPEIPDLWNRIEAALPVDEEIPAPVELIKSDSLEPTKTTSVEQKKSVPVKTTTKSNVKPFNKAKLYRWSSVAAACLCACIVIPIALKDVHGCGSKSETAAFDEAPAAMEAPMEEYDMGDGAAAGEAAADSISDDYFYSDIMEDAATEEVITSGNSSSNATNDWGENTLNIWDAESFVESPSKGTPSESEETVSVFEVTAIIESEILTDGEITGYSLLITEDLSDSLNTDRIVGYLSEEFANQPDEYEIVLEKEYVVSLRLNDKYQWFEIVDMK